MMIYYSYTIYLQINQNKFYVLFKFINNNYVLVIL